MAKCIHTSSVGVALCFLFLTASSAGAEIIRCIDNTGSITLTNAACSKNPHVTQTPLVIAAPTAGKGFSQQEKFLAAEKARSITALDKITSGKQYSIDEMTVRGAKAATDLMDIASDLARQEASAEKALRANRWAFWRT